MMKSRVKKALDIQDRLSENDARTPNTFYRGEGTLNLLWAPAVYDFSKKSLFRIVGNVRAKTIQNMSVVAVWTSHKLLCGHPGLERLHNKCE